MRRQCLRLALYWILAAKKKRAEEVSKCVLYCAFAIPASLKSCLRTSSPLHSQSDRPSSRSLGEVAAIMSQSHRFSQGQRQTTFSNGWAKDASSQCHIRPPIPLLLHVVDTIRRTLLLTVSLQAEPLRDRAVLPGGLGQLLLGDEGLLRRLRKEKGRQGFVSMCLTDCDKWSVDNAIRARIQPFRHLRIPRSSAVSGSTDFAPDGVPCVPCPPSNQTIPKSVFRIRANASNSHIFASFRPMFMQNFIRTLWR